MALGEFVLENSVFLYNGGTENHTAMVFGQEYTLAAGAMLMLFPHDVSQAPLGTPPAVRAREILNRLPRDHAVVEFDPSAAGDDPQPGGVFDAFIAAANAAAAEYQAYIDTGAPYAAPSNDLRVVMAMAAAFQAAEEDAGLSPDPADAVTVPEDDLPAAAAQDGVPPTVVGTDPADGDIGVSIEIEPRITFSEAMNTNTLNVTCLLIDSNGDSVPLSSVTYSGGNTIAALHPVDDLNPGETYKIRVLTGARDASGTHLEQQYESEIGFITPSETVKPTVDSVTPLDEATGVSVSVHPAVTFSEAMMPGSITAATVYVHSAGFTDPIAASVALSAGDTVATITPDEPLSADTVYKIKVTTAVRDATGNHLLNAYEQATGFHTAA